MALANSSYGVMLPSSGHCMQVVHIFTCRLNKYSYMYLKKRQARNGALLKRHFYKYGSQNTVFKANTQLIGESTALSQGNAVYVSFSPLETWVLVFWEIQNLKMCAVRCEGVHMLLRPRIARTLEFKVNPHPAAQQGVSWEKKILLNFPVPEFLSTESAPPNHPPRQAEEVLQRRHC